ncbi:hypothetical protein [Halomonas getboli]|uniref:hypothetical protein n=1 Tax=Halomonas getboli TaxID=2935862 RepID=UPI001FFF3251|nr:hypothetical protein [Halomonas getboli]
MTLPSCIHCEYAPERRESGDRVMYICPVCNGRGDASTAEAWAAASWCQVNRDDLSACRCGHRARFRARDGQWWACCTGCQHRVGGFMSLQGAVAGWARSLR